MFANADGGMGKRSKYSTNEAYVNACIMAVTWHDSVIHSLHVVALAEANANRISIETLAILHQKNIIAMNPQEKQSQMSYPSKQEQTQTQQTQIQTPAPPQVMDPSRPPGEGAYETYGKSEKPERQ